MKHPLSLLLLSALTIMSGALRAQQLPWRYVDGGFSLNRSTVPFLAVGNTVLVAPDQQGYLRIYRLQGGRWLFDTSQALPRPIAVGGLSARARLIDASSINSGTVFYSSIDTARTWSAAGIRSGDSIIVGRAYEVFSTTYRTFAAYHPSSGSSTSRGVLRTTDNGASWAACQFPPFGAPEDTIRALIEVDSQLVLASRRVYSSIDSGRTWTYVNTLSQVYPRETIAALAVIGHDLFAGTSNNLPSNACGVYRSSDKGATWDSLAGLPDGIRVSAMATMRDTLFVASMNGGLYRSTDLGNTWTDVDPTGSHKRVFALSVNGARLVALVDSGFYWYDASLPIAAVQQSMSKQLRNVRLIPNPTTGTTILSFESDGETPVSVTVFDVLGSAVLQLLPTPAQLNASIPLATGSLPPGTYYIRITSGKDMRVYTLVRD